jgi:hypothetical protein
MYAFYMHHKQKTLCGQDGPHSCTHWLGLPYYDPFSPKPDQSGANRTVWVVGLRRSAGVALTLPKGNEEYMSENKRPCMYNGWEEHKSNSAEQGEHEQHAYVIEARTLVGDTKGTIGRSQPFFSSGGQALGSHDG